MIKRTIKAPHALNEAYEYEKPVPFSRGMKVEINGVTMLFISGTASVNENGESVHIGDFEAQVKRMFMNITELLKSESATWHNIVKTTIFLKNMDEHYHELAEIRTEFFDEQGITVYPASTCVQETLCRPELLVEMEAIAIMDNTDDSNAEN